MMRTYKALVKYQCMNLHCWREFLTMESSPETEQDMVCPFCQCGVESVVGGDPDIQEFYDDMGCLYPGGESIEE